MKISAILKTALRALFRNPTRTVLTMLGIVIGIAAVITMMEIGSGSAKAIRSSIESMGASNILILPGAARQAGVSKGSGSVMSLTPQDYIAIRQNAEHVSAAAPLVMARGQQAIVGNRNWTPETLVGSTPSYIEIRNWSLAEGEIFDDRDLQSSAAVCVVGQTIIRELFDGVSPIGREVRIKNVMFRVIGTLAPKGANMMGQDQDDVIVTPWTTMRQRVAGSRTSSGGTSTPEITTNTTYPGGGVSLYPAQSETQRTNYRLSPRFVYVDQIMVQAITPDDADAVVDEVTAILRERHKLRAGEPNDFNIRNFAEMSKTLSSTSTLMTNLLLGVALISLVVGGVGIMNIMLVSVTERTREIGLRMAIGARSRDILKQFLIESIVLCLVGGIVGVICGHSASLLVNSQLGWPIEASPLAVTAAVGVSAAVGIIFGFYPAWKASRLDPIEALRYE